MRFSSCDTYEKGFHDGDVWGPFSFAVLISWLRSNCQLTIELMVCFRSVFFLKLFNKIAHSGVQELRKLF